MKRDEWTQLLIKLLALYQVYLGLLAIPNLSFMYSSYKQAGFEDLGILLAVGSLLPLLFAILLWVYTERVSRWFWHGSETKKTIQRKGSTRSTNEVKVVVVIGLGLFVFLIGIPDLVLALGNFYLEIYFNSGALRPAFIPEIFISRLALILQLLIAAAFMFLPKRVLAFLDKVQGAWDLRK